MREEGVATPPPEQLTLTWCPECGKNNRFAWLHAYDPETSAAAAYHMDEGTRDHQPKRCYGRPVKLAYTLDRSTLPGREES